MGIQEMMEDPVWSINELELDRQLSLENRVEPRKFIGSGEDVCLEELLDD